MAPFAAGKEDLDLHLDDFLLTGKFDLIAYADPELNLEDKKDMFNEELDLGEPAEDRDGSRASVKTDGSAHFPIQAKEEMKEAQRTGGESSAPPPAPPIKVRLRLVPHSEQSQSSYLTSTFICLQEKLEDSGPGPAVHTQEALSSVHPLMSPGKPGNHPPLVGVMELMKRLPPPSPGEPAAFQHRPLAPGPQTQFQSPHPGAEIQSTNPASLQDQQNKSRPLLLEEQPLLLQELLDQERQEQQQQKQMQALIRHQPGPESAFPNIGEPRTPSAA